MTARVDRTIAHGNSMIVQRKSEPDENISSPLQVFGQAKKLINNIFVDIQDYVADASERITGNYLKILI